MDGGTFSVANRPMSSAEITKKAEEYEYNPLIHLKYWLRSAGTMLKQAEIYEREGNDQQAFLLRFRHANLVLNNLAKHPEAKANGKKDPALFQAERVVQRQLGDLEKLKGRIDQRYKRYEKAMRLHAANQPTSDSASHQNIQRSIAQNTGPHKHHISDPAIAGAPRAIAAADNTDFAVNLVQKEMKRRRLAKKSVKNERIPAIQEKLQRIAVDDEDQRDEELRKMMEDTRRHMDGACYSDETEPDDHRRNRLYKPRQPEYRYPTVPHRSVYDTNSISSSYSSYSTIGPAPEVPIKQRLDQNNYSISPPLLPPKPDLPPIPDKAPLDPSPSPDTISRPSTPSDATIFKPSAYLENGTPLRTIFLPPDIRSTFLQIARPNTLAKLETCGILCGTLISNAFFIRKLLIPEQESTSDTCETTNESAIFDYCDAEDLMVLGWIHTHPTQTCFMSSRDLHTHCGYQVMLPESIAIVLAPSKEPSWGVFRLTDPPGMKSVLNCTLPGIFHPHPERNIYTDALRPGHVVEAKGLEFEVVDLRP